MYRDLDKYMQRSWFWIFKSEFSCLNNVMADNWLLCYVKCAISTTYCKSGYIMHYYVLWQKATKWMQNPLCSVLWRKVTSRLSRAAHCWSHGHKRWQKDKCKETNGHQEANSIHSRILQTVLYITRIIRCKRHKWQWRCRVTSRSRRVNSGQEQ